jgi:hypothetical protein
MIKKAERLDGCESTESLYNEIHEKCKKEKQRISAASRILERGIVFT